MFSDVDSYSLIQCEFGLEWREIVLLRYQWHIFEADFDCGCVISHLLIEDPILSTSAHAPAPTPTPTTTDNRQCESQYVPNSPQSRASQKISPLIDFVTITSPSKNHQPSPAATSGSSRQFNHGSSRRPKMAIQQQCGSTTNTSSPMKAP
jgi:hypothetical protein